MRRPALLFLLLLLCWLPCYLSVCPGNFMYDGSYEYYQMTRNEYSRSFPLLHTVIITRLLAASEALTGSVNPGIAVYVVAQMLLIALLFTRILRKLYADGVPAPIMAASIAYCALFPSVHLLVTCTTRDVLFSALMTCTVYLFYRLASDPAGFAGSALNMIKLAASLVFTLLSRNNNSGPLAMLLLLAACVLLCLCFGRKYIRNSLIFVLVALCLFGGTSTVLESMCQPLYNSPPSSSMSLIAQPIVRAYMLYGDTWSEEDRAAFHGFFNMETLEYFPQNADPAKGNLTVRYANMRAFIAFWIKIGLRHPACYMDGVLAATRQMWFPDCYPDGYTVRETNPHYHKCYFYFGRYVEEIGSRLNLLPGVFRFYENIGLQISYEKIPVLSMLFSIGFHVWLLLHSVFYVAYRRRYALLWPLGILLVYVLCCAFVPLVLLRYFGALFLCFPMVLAFTLCPDRLKAKP